MPNPPKPIERKRRAGTLRADRMPKGAITAEIEALPASGPVPEHLGPAGAAMYRLVVRACEGWLGQGDEPVLLLLAEAADRRAGLLERLRDEGEVLHTVDGYTYAHPAAGMVGTIDAQMTRWYSLLGLTPRDRSRLGLVHIERSSKLDGLGAGRDRRPQRRS